MSDRVTLHQAIDDADEVWSQWNAKTILDAVRENEIVTPERAALETMAERECTNGLTRELGINCVDYYAVGLTHGRCAPCWARYVINQTQQPKDTTT